MCVCLSVLLGVLSVLNYMLLHYITYLHTYLLTDWLTNWLTYLLTHSLMHSLTYILPYLLTSCSFDNSFRDLVQHVVACVRNHCPLYCSYSRIYFRGHFLVHYPDTTRRRQSMHTDLSRLRPMYVHLSSGRHLSWRHHCSGALPSIITHLLVTRRLRPPSSTMMTTKIASSP